MVVGVGEGMGVGKRPWEEIIRITGACDPIVRERRQGLEFGEEN